MINDNHCTRGTEGQQISFEQAQSFPAHSPLRKGESTSRAGPIFKTPLATGFPVQSGYGLIPLPVDGSQIQISGANKLSCLSVILFCPIVHVFPNRLQRREDLDAFCLVFCYSVLSSAILSCSLRLPLLSFSSVNMETPNQLIKVVG